MSGHGRVGAVIVGAGGGRRLGGVEKAFMTLGGQPLICHSVLAFETATEIDAICLVVAPDSVQRGQDLAREHGWKKVMAVVSGGAERQDSVRAGLEALAGCEWVLIHDAARPLVTQAMIREGLAAARAHGAAVAATPVRDTLKRAASEGRFPVIGDTVDRSALWAAQTPQVFRASLLRDAYIRVGAAASRFTDDGGLVQAAGFPVHVFAGDPRNVKVTLPEDVMMVESLLGTSNESVPRGAPRVGTGYDIHRTEAGRRLVLGGVELPSDFGLAGHSDADVLTHALIDALFGACGLPDIGRHFPPGDPRYAGADSIGLLEEARRLAAGSGWEPVSADSTVICERPKLAPHISAMRARLAGALRLPAEAVNVKAKTNEGLDAVGRGDAIAAQAIILVKYTRG